MDSVGLDIALNSTLNSDLNPTLKSGLGLTLNSGSLLITETTDSHIYNNLSITSEAWRT